MSRRHVASAPDRRDRSRTGLAWAGALALIAGAALLLRTGLLVGRVVAGGAVRFLETDPWYHMRLIDNLAANFPHRLAFDPYLFFPGGQPVDTAPLLDLLVAGVALVLGGGAPSARTLDLTGAWLPPLVGALVTLPVYAIGRRLFGRSAGLFAAALLAVEPGLFLARSLLGYTDHHVLEVALSTLTMLALMRSLDRPAPGAVAPSPGHATARAWRALGAAAPAGVALGAYMLAWAGGSFLVALLLAWAVLQMAIETFRGRDPGYVARALSPVAAIALVLVVPFLHLLSRPGLHLASLGALLGLPPALALVSAEIRSRRLPPLLLPLAAVALLAGAALVVRVTAPEPYARLLAFLARLAPGGTALTVGEVRPLLTMSGSLSLRPAWDIFSAPLFLAVVALVPLAGQAFRDPRPGLTLLALWSATMLAATLAQARFGYYLAVNAALLAAYLWWRLWSPRLDGTRPAGQPGGGAVPVGRRALAAAVAVAAFSPCLRPALATAGRPTGPPPEWRDALAWLRGHSPDPMGGPEAYLQRFEAPAEGGAFAYPPSAYGVLAWWDYGYWILRVARRIPNANPTQRGADTAAAFLAATDPQRAFAVLDRAGTRYVVVDDKVGIWPPNQVLEGSGMLAAVLGWAGDDPARVRQVLWSADADGTPRPFVLYLPEYFRTMAVRLYLSNPAPSPPGPAWVVASRERADARGRPFRELVSARSFDSWAEAEAFRGRQSGPGWLLGSVDPASSCLPIEPLDQLRLVHESVRAGGEPGVRPHRVRVFEYTGWRPGSGSGG